MAPIESYTERLHRRWLKLTTPLWGRIPATGYWASGKEYYQNYQGQLPHLEYHICHPAHQVTYPLPQSIHPNIHDCFTSRPERKIPEAYWLTVPNSTILRAYRSMGSVIAHDHKVIHNSSRQSWAKADHNEALYHKFPPSQTVNCCIAVTTDGGGGLNYWHWLLDILPRIYLLKHGDIWSKIDYFLVDEPFNKMLMTLEIMGVQKHQIIYTRYNHSLQTPLAVLPHFIQEKSRWIVNFLRAYFLPHRATSFGATTKIYISRKKAARRRILNEDQVLDYLTPRGYVACYLEDLSFPEQIGLFSHAKYVIGLHGAGMTNLVWCEPGSRILEIFPAIPWRDSYWMLSNEAGIDYYYWCAPSPTENATINDDLMIDMKQFAQVFDHFES